MRAPPTWCSNARRCATVPRDAPSPVGVRARRRDVEPARRHHCSPRPSALPYAPSGARGCPGLLGHRRRQCTKWTSQFVPPKTIRVLRTSATDPPKKVQGHRPGGRLPRLRGHGHGGRVARALSHSRRSRPAPSRPSSSPGTTSSTRAVAPSGSTARRSATTSSTPRSTSATSPRRTRHRASPTAARTQDHRGHGRHLGRLAAQVQAATAEQPLLPDRLPRRQLQGRLRRGRHRLQALPQQHPEVRRGRAQVPRDPAPVPQAQPRDRRARPQATSSAPSTATPAPWCEGLRAAATRASGRPGRPRPSRAPTLASRISTDDLVGYALGRHERRRPARTSCGSRRPAPAAARIRVAISNGVRLRRRPRTGGPATRSCRWPARSCCSATSTPTSAPTWPSWREGAVGGQPRAWSCSSASSTPTPSKLLDPDAVVVGQRRTATRSHSAWAGDLSGDGRADLIVRQNPERRRRAHQDRRDQEPAARRAASAWPLKTRFESTLARSRPRSR